ncbi:MAG: hypothetical protein AABX17_00635 [Nanoarchaeota archaeon]
MVRTTCSNLDVTQSLFLEVMHPEFGLKSLPPKVDIYSVDNHLIQISFGTKRKLCPNRTMSGYHDWINRLEAHHLYAVYIDKKYRNSKSPRILCYELGHELGHYLHCLNDRKAFHEYLYDPLKTASNFFELVAELSILSYAAKHGGHDAVNYSKRYLNSRVFNAALRALERKASVKDILERKEDKEFIDSFWV